MERAATPFDFAQGKPYGSANRLTQLTQGANTYTYSYNGTGDRVRQTVNGTPTNYTLDLNSGLTQVLSDSSNAYLYGLTRIGEQQPSGWQYHLPDALGSVRQLTDVSGVVTLAKSYEPYGTVLSSAGSGASAYGYTGEQQAGGLVYLRARYYAPGQGRFLTRDAWEGNDHLPMSYNAWLYVYADPANLVDPSGLKGIKDWNGYWKAVLEEKRINIRKNVITVREIDEILLNFAGNPERGGITFVYDVQRYNSCLYWDVTDETGQLVRKLYAINDYNRYDWLFSGWVDYWKWRANSEGKPFYAVDPNLFKAVSQFENKLGTEMTAPPGSRITLMNLKGDLRQLAMGEPWSCCTADGKDFPLQEPDKGRVLRQHDLTWGYIRVSYDQLARPDYEIGVAVRVFNAKYYLWMNQPDLKGKPPETIWKATLQSFGPKESSHEYTPCYGELVWGIYATGLRRLNCNSNRYMYVWSSPTPRDWSPRPRDRRR